MKQVQFQLQFSCRPTAGPRAFSDSHALSPVIGTILMVAVAVIMAGMVLVIASGVYAPLIDDIEPFKKIVVSAEKLTTDEIAIVFMGGEEAREVTYFTMTAPNGTFYYTSDESGTLLPGTGPGARPAVGTTMRLLRNPATDSPWTAGNHLVVTAHLDTGGAIVIYDKVL
jgi:flagellin-like protein